MVILYSTEKATIIIVYSRFPVCLEVTRTRSLDNYISLIIPKYIENCGLRLKPNDKLNYSNITDITK